MARANDLINEMVLITRTMLIPGGRPLDRLRGNGFVRIVHGFGLILILGYVVGAAMQGWADARYLLAPTLVQIGIEIVIAAVLLAVWRLINEGLALALGAALGEKTKPDLSPDAFRV